MTLGQLIMMVIQTVPGINIDYTIKTRAKVRLAGDVVLDVKGTTKHCEDQLKLFLGALIIGFNHAKKV